MFSENDLFADVDAENIFRLTYQNKTLSIDEIFEKIYSKEYSNKRFTMFINGRSLYDLEQETSIYVNEKYGIIQWPFYIKEFNFSKYTPSDENLKDYYSIPYNIKVAVIEEYSYQIMSRKE